MAPSYANLFMGSLEEDFLNLEDSKPDLWLRFIDDIFLLWTQGHDSLLFIESLNSRYPVRFTWTIFPSHVNFLDIEIFVDKSGFRTSIHIKLTPRSPSATLLTFINFFSILTLSPAPSSPPWLLSLPENPL